MAVGALTLGAQPLITLRPAPDQVPPGIAIITPSDPSFQSLAGKLLPPAAVPLYQHILPYAILIRNETATPVIATVLSIQITDSTGRTSKPMPYHLGTTPPGKKEVVLAPGRDMLFTADPRFTQLAPILSLFNDAKQKERMGELANRPLEPYISARAITLALDSVLFADGTLEAPDEENAFETWMNALRIETTFERSVLALQGRGADELSQYLATAANGPRQQGHPWGLPDTNHLAKSYERTLRDKGPERVFTISKDNLKQATELTIHR